MEFGDAFVWEWNTWDGCRRPTAQGQGLQKVAQRGTEEGRWGVGVEQGDPGSHQIPGVEEDGKELMGTREPTLT